MLTNAVAIFIGGGLGSLARFGISMFVLTRMRSMMPWGTIAANALACIIFAVVFSRFSEVEMERTLLKPLIIIGFCGGFSTFSTFSYETIELIRSGNVMFAVANVAISILLCLFLIYFIQKTLI